MTTATIPVATDPVVDLRFRLTGDTLPADHGYALYAAISAVVPTIHRDDRVGILPIDGRLIGGRTLTLDPQSRLTVRLPASQIPAALPLAGRSLEILGHRVMVGVPEVFTLRAAPRLVSRLVVIKGFLEPASFQAAAERQFAALGLSGIVALPESRLPASLEGHRSAPVGPIRRTIRIAGRTIVGYALVADGLSPEDSVLLQAVGLGGRRRLGCGCFVPAS